MDRRGAIGETLTWIPSTVLIIFFMVVFVVGTQVYASVRFADGIHALSLDEQPQALDSSLLHDLLDETIDYDEFGPISFEDGLILWMLALRSNDEATSNLYAKLLLDKTDSYFTTSDYPECLLFSAQYRIEGFDDLGYYYDVNPYQLALTNQETKPDRRLFPRYIQEVEPYVITFDEEVIHVVVLRRPTC